MDCLDEHTSTILYSQKILDVDWYLTTPLKGYDPSFCYLSNTSIQSVPVLRIFGPTPTGQSSCLHIHGVFPYLYIPLPVGIDPSPHWIAELYKSMNTAISSELPPTNQCSHHVYDIKIVAAKPFYGYHPTRRIFLQIFLYNPSHIRLLADILLTGVVMNIPLQPHESHIPYTLQFMIDYNLYGMNQIYLSNLQFRFSQDDVEEPLYSISAEISSSFSSRVWTLSTLQEDLLHAEGRHSICDLEMDTNFHSILNPTVFSESDNPGLAALWDGEKWRRKKEGLSPNVPLPSEIVRHINCSEGELQLLEQFKNIIAQRIEIQDKGEKSVQLIYLSTTQLPEREDPSTSILLSPSSIYTAGENQMISSLSELDIGILKEEVREFNIGGQVISIPSSLPDQIGSGDAFSRIPGSTLEATFNLFNEHNSTHSFNIALIRNEILAASSQYLPPEHQGNIMSSLSPLVHEDNILSLKDIISETYLLSQPLNFSFPQTSNQVSYLPHLQLDGNGYKARRKSYSRHANVARQRNYKTRSEIGPPQEGSTVSDPILSVSISRKTLNNKFTLQTTFPFPKELVLKINRLSFDALYTKVNQKHFTTVPKDNSSQISDIRIPPIPEIRSLLRQVDKTPSLQSSSSSDFPTSFPIRSDILVKNGENLVDDERLSDPNDKPSQCATSFLLAEKEITTLPQIGSFDYSNQKKNEDFPVAECTIGLHDSRIVTGIASNSVDEKSAQIDRVSLLIPNLLVKASFESKCDVDLYMKTSHSNSYVSSQEYSNDYLSPNDEFSTEEIKDVFHSPRSTDTTVSPDVSLPVNHSSDILQQNGNIRIKQGLRSSPQIAATEICNDTCTSLLKPNEGDNPPSDIDQLFSPKLCDLDVKSIVMEPSDYQLSVSPVSENSERIAIHASTINSPPNSHSSSSGLLSSDTTLSPSHSQNNLLPIQPVCMKKILIKADNRYSSVSSESESDNYLYRYSDSLVMNRSELPKSDIERCLVSELDKNGKSTTSSTVHSTPLFIRSSSDSPKSNNTHSHSPIVNDTPSHNFRMTHLDVDIIDPNLPVNILSSVNLAEPSSRDPTVYFHYENFVNSETLIEPNLTYYSQIEGPTLASMYNFKLNFQQLHDINVIESRVCQFITQMSVEILVRTRVELAPDPRFDSILAVCYYVSTHDYHSQDLTYISGVLSLTDTWDIEDLKKSDCLAHTNFDNVVLTYSTTEIDLFQELISRVLEYDPDICVGYEYQRLSWGYLIERACVFGIDLPFCLSRAQPPGSNPRNDLKEKPYSYNYTNPHIVGRILLNLWRICKHELTLSSYTFENVAYHALHQRFTQFSNDILTKWYSIFPSRNRWRPLQYYLLRAQANIRIIESLDIVGRTSELSRIFGIEFHDVLARGTQYRVESMMLRLLKRHEYITVSPSVRQRSKMLPPSVIPLIMEPRDSYFTEPVVVLDFQSLYPSIIIAHNYCYSTCLGKLEHFNNDNTIPFGSLNLEIPDHMLGNLKPSDVTISPNGVVFVKSHIRKGMLPIMLEEILKTRVMVKHVLKENILDPYLFSLLNTRQLGLKNIANVTFGYTQANLSGRMPCVELGDSIVAKARETLEQSMHFIAHSSKFNAQVIYGDTDSIFILLSGITREKAFTLGSEMTKLVTQMFCEPIKIKLEKVYQPLLLIQKKRYVGLSYDTAEQIEPKFDAKGIETVRRDSCPFVAKLLEHSLDLLFRTGEMDQVREKVIQQTTKLFRGLISIQDLTFSNEFRGIKGYQPGMITPSLHISKLNLLKDPRSEPRIGSRVPYVYVYCNLDSLLVDLLRPPEQLLADSSLHINAHYYLHTHILPSLMRVLDRAGANVYSWIHHFPRLFRPIHYDILNPIEKKGLSNLIDLKFCAICDTKGEIGLCQLCLLDLERKRALIGRRFRISNYNVDLVHHLCKTCQGDSLVSDCISTDCPVLYKRLRISEEFSYAKRLSDVYLSHSYDLSF